MIPLREADEENLVSPAVQASSSSLFKMPKTWREVKDWMQCIAWTLLTAVLLMFAAAGVMHYIRIQSPTSRLHCYECIVITGADAGEPGLPFEAKCETAPTNWRICNIGEVCTTGKMKGGGMTRYQRACSSDYKKIGCSALEKTEFGTEEMYCACDKDYCK